MELARDNRRPCRLMAPACEKMKHAKSRNRVTVYYLLAEHFGKIPVFAGR